MAIKSILFGIFFTGIGLICISGGFWSDPVIWEAVGVGALAVLVAPILVWSGVRSLTRHRPGKAETALDALDAINNLLK